MAKEHSANRYPQRVLPISVLESSTEFTVKADLPGVSKDQIKVDFELGLLFLEANLLPEESGDEEVLLQEVTPCQFKRTLKMSTEIDSESIKATFESGVLIVNLPKKKSAMKRQIPIFQPKEDLALQQG